MSKILSAAQAAILLCSCSIYFTSESEKFINYISGAVSALYILPLLTNDTTWLPNYSLSAAIFFLMALINNYFNVEFYKIVLNCLNGYVLALRTGLYMETSSYAISFICFFLHMNSVRSHYLADVVSSGVFISFNALYCMDILRNSFELNLPSIKNVNYFGTFSFFIASMLNLYSCFIVDDTEHTYLFKGLLCLINFILYGTIELMQVKRSNKKY